MRNSLLTLTLAGALLALPANALAKCATVDLSAAPGGELNIKVFMPGAGVIGDVRPKVYIRQGDTREVFAAASTKRMGIYRVNVTFPGAGLWHFAVSDGFDAMEHGAGAVHRFEPVQVPAGETQLNQVPKRLGKDDCRAMMEPVALDSPEGQLPPASYGAEPAADETDDDGGVSAASLVAAGAVLLLVGGAIALRRRTRREI